MRWQSRRRSKEVSVRFLFTERRDPSMASSGLSRSFPYDSQRMSYLFVVVHRLASACSGLGNRRRWRLEKGVMIWTNKSTAMRRQDARGISLLTKHLQYSNCELNDHRSRGAVSRSTN